MWAQAQDDAFSNAKHLISTAPVLQYYDVLNKPVTLQILLNATQDHTPYKRYTVSFGEIGYT